MSVHLSVLCDLLSVALSSWPTGSYSRHKSLNPVTNVKRQYFLLNMREKCFCWGLFSVMDEEKSCFHNDNALIYFTKLHEHFLLEVLLYLTPTTFLVWLFLIIVALRKRNNIAGLQLAIIFIVD